MYKSNKFRRVIKPPSAPLPVILSQKPVEGNNKDEDIISNSQDSQEEIPKPSGQRENASQISLASQSRFLSQRHQISRLTQEHEIRGKNYFEIALNVCKIQITDMGCEFMSEGDDSVSFIRRFRSFLGSLNNQSNNDNTKKFIDGFNKTFSLKHSINTAQKFLSGCIMKESQKTYQSQTSLIQCFFAVKTLKDEIATILLNNLKAYVVERGDQSDGFIVGLVVAQFKFSDQLLAPETYNIMYEQFFEILAATKNDTCRSVIISNFRDLDEFKQDDAVKRLMNMYEDDYKLLTPFIETFTEMCISDDTKTRVSSLVQHLLEDCCSPKLYPGIVKYLLCYSESPADIIDQIRKHLKWSSDGSTNRNDLKAKVCLLLEKSLRREKSKIAEAWIKALSSLENPEDLKPIDFVMMMMITSVKEEKFPAVKKILLQRVPQGFFSDDYLKNVFKTFPNIIAQHSETLLELLNALQKNNIYEVNEFSSTCFKEMFGIELSDKKEIVGSLVKFLCEKNPGLPFAPRADFKMMTLNILGEMSKTQSSAEALLVNHKILLRVLDRSKVKLTYNEHRLVMELLCKLAYATNYKTNHNKFEAQKLEEERCVLQEHLEMMSNKLMCNTDLKIKELGIIGSVKIVSSLVVNFVMSSELVHSEDITIDDIPAGPIKDAASKVDFIFQSVRDNPQGFAMICDEMSLEFQGKRDQFEINEVFLSWLSELLRKKLDNIAVPVADQLPEIPDIQLSHQLNVDQFSQPNISVGLGLLIFDKKTNDVIFTPALFKIVRLLTTHRYHSLESVHDFSVMPLVLTDTFGSLEDELSETNEVMTRQKLDLYFHCINWLREIIGAFCHWTASDQEVLTEVVIQRIKQLVQIEKRLNQLLAEVPENYYPPLATFHNIEGSRKAFDQLRKEMKITAKPPKKKRKKNDSTIMGTTPNQSSMEPTETVNKIRQFCREIDTQVILMLREDFNVNNSRKASDTGLGLQELMFLLDDVYHKVSSTCNARNAEQKGFYDPIQTIYELKETVIVYLVKIFQSISKELVSLSQIADDDDSNDVFYTNDANMLKNCFCMILKLFDVVFSCPQLKHQKNAGLLNEALKALIPSDMENEDIESQDEMCDVIVKHCLTYEKNVKNCESAVALVKFLSTISDFSSKDEMRSLVLELCERFLKKEWKNSSGDDEQGAIFNGNLENLLQMFVRDASLDKLEELINKMHLDFQHIISKQLSYQETFPSFNKGNSIHMMRTYMTRLSVILTKMDPTAMNYKFFQRCSKIYKDFCDVMKCIGSANVALVFLRNVLFFIKAFNTQGMAVLKQCVGKKPKFIDLVKAVQIITRASHGVSCDLRHRKNKAIVSIIPKLREALNKNTQGVLNLLPLVQIDRSAIFIGSLKNYDMGGDDIISQNISEVADEDEEDEEEEVMDVSDDDNNDGSEEPRHGSFRSRSTIV